MAEHLGDITEHTELLPDTDKVVNPLRIIGIAVDVFAGGFPVAELADLLVDKAKKELVEGPCSVLSGYPAGQKVEVSRSAHWKVETISLHAVSPPQDRTPEARVPNDYADDSWADLSQIPSIKVGTAELSVELSPDGDTPPSIQAGITDKGLLFQAQGSSILDPASIQNFDGAPSGRSQAPNWKTGLR